MPTIQLVVSEEDRRRFTLQAAHDGKRLEEWLIFIARQHSPEPPPPTRDRFKSAEELMAFLKKCSAESGLEREPDWEEHLRNIDESRRQGLPDVG